MYFPLDYFKCFASCIFDIAIYFSLQDDWVLKIWLGTEMQNCKYLYS